MDPTSISTTSPSFTTCTQHFRDAPPATNVLQAYKLDEGYSEETRSQPGSDTNLRSPMGSIFMTGDGSTASLPAWVTTLDEVERIGAYQTSPMLEIQTLTDFHQSWPMRSCAPCVLHLSNPSSSDYTLYYISILSDIYHPNSSFISFPFYHHPYYLLLPLYHNPGDLGF